MAHLGGQAVLVEVSTWMGTPLGAPDPQTFFLFSIFQSPPLRANSKASYAHLFGLHFCSTQLLWTLFSGTFSKKCLY